MYEFSGLGHTIESRLTGTVFKILDTRQSEILIEFSRNIPFNSPKNSRSLLRNLQRFQTLSWLQSWRNCRAWAYYKISMVSALIEIRSCWLASLDWIQYNSMFRDFRNRSRFVNKDWLSWEELNEIFRGNSIKNFRLPGI